MHPVIGPVTQEFGDYPDFAWQLGYGHLGIDYGVNEGTPVKAIADGAVLWSDWSINMPVDFARANMFVPGAPGGGITVLLQHGGYRGIYAHLSKTDLTNGQRVKRGDIIGYSGTTGNSTGPHLHFEVYTYPCSNYPPFSRYNPRDQIAEEDRIAGAAPSIAPAGNITPAAPTPKAEGFLMALNDQQQKELYDRIMGGLPAGAARSGKEIGNTPRLADSGDIYDIKQRLAKLLDTTGGDVILRAVFEATGKTTDDLRKFQEVANAENAKLLTTLAKGNSGVNPADIANQVIAAMGEGLAAEVVKELSNRLATKEDAK